MSQNFGVRSGEGGVATYKVGGSEAETEGLRLALDADMTGWWSLVAFLKRCFVFVGAVEASDFAAVSKLRRCAERVELCCAI